MSISSIQRVIAFVIGALCFSSASIACAIDVTDRPYQNYFGWIALDAVGAGRAGLVVIDTGSEDSIIAPSMVPADSRLESRQATDPNGPQMARFLVGTTNALSMNGKGLPLTEPGVMDLPQAPGQPPLLAIIGQDILSHCVINLDQQQRRISIRSKPADVSNRPSFALTILGERRLYHAQIEMAGGRLFGLIDTGRSEELALSGQIARAFRSVTAQSPWTTIPVNSLSAERVAEVVTIDSMKVGPLDFSRVEVRSVTDPDLRSPIMATLGLGIFQCHRLTLDFPGQRAWADAIPGCNRPILTRSGLLMQMTENGAVASFIMANSPAVTSGMKIGDAICSINGQAVDVNYPSSPLANWSRAPAGTRAKIGLCDGRMAEITLTDFY